MVAGGMESMSNVPYYMTRGQKFNGYEILIGCFSSKRTKIILKSFMTVRFEGETINRYQISFHLLCFLKTH
jgi:acetyl-CoA acetyltransferase